MNSLSLMLKPRSLQRSCLPQSRPILSSRESAKPFQRMREEREGREIRWGKHALFVSQSLSRPRGSYGIRSSVRRPLSPSLHPVIHRRSERTGHTTIDRAVTVFVKAVLPSLLPPFIIRSPERERGGKGAFESTLLLLYFLWDISNQLRLFWPD